MKIFNSIINPYSQDRLENTVNGREFKWVYTKGEVSVEFVNELTFDKDDQIFAAWVWHILDNVMDKTEIGPFELQNVKFKLQYQNPNITSVNCNRPTKLNGVLYIINDNDSEVIFFDDCCNEVERIKTKKGSIIHVDNRLYAITNPVQSFKTLTVEFKFHD